MLLESQQQKVSDGWTPSKRTLLDDQSLRLAAATPSAASTSGRQHQQRERQRQAIAVPPPETTPVDASSSDALDESNAHENADANGDAEAPPSSSLPPSRPPATPPGPAPPLINIIDALISYLVHLTSNVLVVNIRWPPLWYVPLSTHTTSCRLTSGDLHVLLPPSENNFQSQVPCRILDLLPTSMDPRWSWWR